LQNDAPEELWNEPGAHAVHIEAPDPLNVPEPQIRHDDWPDAGW